MGAREVMPGKKRELFARWADKVAPQGVNADACWLWKGTTRGTRGRYGIIRRGARDLGWVSAHIFAFCHFRRTVRKGFVLDHTCENMLCVNPWHLDEVRQKTNIDRRTKRRRLRVRLSDRQIMEVPL